VNEVAFHFNAPDKVHYAARLVRKAVARGNRLLVLTDPEDMGTLDTALWTLEPDAFLAHALDNDPVAVRQRSPVLLACSLAQDFDADVLVNLRHAWVDTWVRFAKVVEVVSEDETDRQAARDRWRMYRQNGVEPVHHDLRSRTG
jgi:DNA polymerase-3 subunit chi